MTRKKQWVKVSTVMPFDQLSGKYGEMNFFKRKKESAGPLIISSLEKVRISFHDVGFFSHS